MSGFQCVTNDMLWELRLAGETTWAYEYYTQQGRSGFFGPYGSKLSVVVEGKQKDNSCLNAKSQAQIYAEQPGRETCNRLIVTDGNTIRYIFPR